MVSSRENRIEREPEMRLGISAERGAERKGWAKRGGMLFTLGVFSIAITVVVGAALVEASDAGSSDSPLHDDRSLVIDCEVSDVPLALAAWNCYGEKGAYFGWWLTPEETASPTGRPRQPAKIASDGAFGGNLRTSLQFIMGYGAQAQAPGTDPGKWNAAQARAHVEKVRSPQGKTPIDYVLAGINAPNSCPGDVSVELAARVGYVVAAIGEDPATVATRGDRPCNLVQITQNARNPVTGQYGVTFEDSLWAVHALAAWGLLPEIGARVQTLAWFRSQTGKEGAWLTADGQVSFQRSSLGITALLALGLPPTDPLIYQAVHVLAAYQNDDGGFGFEPVVELVENPSRLPALDRFPGAAPPLVTEKTVGYVRRSTAVDTAQVHGALLALDARGASAYWNVFLRGKDPHQGRMGIQVALGEILHNQRPGFFDARNGDGEGRFLSHAGSIDDDPQTSPENPAEIIDPLPTVTAIYYLGFWDPIFLLSSGNDADSATICPGVPVKILSETPLASCPARAIVAEPNAVG